MPTISRPETFGSLTGLVRIVQRNWHLTWALAKREITDRYAGQMLGMLWTVGNPLLLMGVYLFIFGVVFRVRIGGTIDLPMGYTTYILSGLIPWFAVSESLNKGCSIITGNSNLVKQVVFPLEILPIKARDGVVLLAVYLLWHVGRLCPGDDALPALDLRAAAGVGGVAVLVHHRADIHIGIHCSVLSGPERLCSALLRDRHLHYSSGLFTVHGAKVIPTASLCESI